MTRRVLICPTCSSDRRRRRWPPGGDESGDTCSDPWHDEAPEPRPDDPRPRFPDGTHVRHVTGAVGRVVSAGFGRGVPVVFVSWLRDGDSLHPEQRPDDLTVLPSYLELLDATPPTAAEVLAHLDAGGRVQVFLFQTQTWIDYAPFALVVDAMRVAAPDTPQTGLRLVPGRPPVGSRTSTSSTV